MKNAWKKISAAVILAAMLLTMAACGGNSTPSPAASGESSAASSTSEAPAEAPAEVTEESYKAEVKRISDAINAKSADMSGVDATDPAKAAEAMKAIIDEVKPLYEELAALEAPEAFKDAQAKISEGSLASAELLDISLQAVQVGAGLIEGDAAAIAADLQTKIQELTPKATEFAAALQEVLA